MKLNLKIDPMNMGPEELEIVKILRDQKDAELKKKGKEGDLLRIPEGLHTFTLVHRLDPSIQLECEVDLLATLSQTQHPYRYDVHLESDLLGAGAEGSVYKSNSLILRPNNPPEYRRSTLFSGTSYASKWYVMPRNEYQDKVEEVKTGAKIKLEEIQHLSFKKDEVYPHETDPDSAVRVKTKMKELKGMTLDKFLKKHNRDITPSVRLAMVRALGIALLEQIQKYDVVHKDIKPQNIMVNFDIKESKTGSKEIEIIRISTDFFDYDLSKKAFYDDSQDISATEGYASFEQSNKGEKTTFKSDIFSLGKVIDEIYQNVAPEEEPIKRLLTNLSYTLMLQRDPTRRATAETLLDKINHIVPFVKEEEVKMGLQQFGINNINKKNWDDLLMAVFIQDKNRIKEICINQLKINNPSDETIVKYFNLQPLNEIRGAYATAVLLRQRMIEVIEQAKNNPQTFITPINVFFYLESLNPLKQFTLLALADNETVITEFVNTLGLKSLASCRTKVEIMNAVKDIYNVFEDETLKNISSLAEVQPKQYQYLLKKIKKFTSIDDVARLNQFIKDHYNKQTKSLVFSQQDPANSDPFLKQLNKIKDLKELFQLFEKNKNEPEKINKIQQKALLMLFFKTSSINFSDEEIKKYTTMFENSSQKADVEKLLLLHKNVLASDIDISISSSP